MSEPTMEEVLALVEFGRDEDGDLFVKTVNGNVNGSVRGKVKGDVCGSIWGNVKDNIEGDIQGNVKGSVWGDVWDDVKGSVRGDVHGSIKGKISGREWQLVQETDRLRAKKKQIYEDLQDAVESEWGQTRMMLAAPDLLEALEGTAALLEQLGFVSDTSLTVGAARAAIAKAKGHTVRVNGGPQERHRCELHSQSGGHGEAVEVCLEDEDGKLWVENGEYASVVFYCPVCGYASRAKAKGEE